MSQAPVGEVTGVVTEATMVRFDRVSKRYGDLVVLDELCLSVKPNEKVAIIGPSGSGKTTVLRLLMTLEQINEGVIYVDGVPLTHESRGGELVRASSAHLRQMRGS
ncbi:MAG TPA: ATP-binding cassette domain-containing protein, partial [Orrella sp.]